MGMQTACQSVQLEIGFETSSSNSTDEFGLHPLLDDSLPSVDIPTRQEEPTLRDHTGSAASGGCIPDKYLRIPSAADAVRQQRAEAERQQSNAGGFGNGGAFQGQVS
jgi:hypothetical protein